MKTEEYIAGDSSDNREWYTLHKFLDVKTHKNNFEDIEFHMIEVPVLRRHLKKSAGVLDSDLEDLLSFWSCKKGDEQMNALVDDVAKRNADVAEMLELEQLFRSDPLLMRQYFIDDRAHIDYVNNMQDSREEGREEGREEEREIWVRKLRSLRSQGILSDEQIAALDVPIEVVKSL